MKLWKKLHLPLWLAAAVLVFALLFLCDVLTSVHLDYFFDFVGYGGTFAYHSLGRYLYWGLMLFGFGLTLVLGWFRRKQYGLCSWAAVVIPLAFFLLAFVGGKLLYLLENIHTVLVYGIGLDGMSLFGAIFLVLAAGAVAGKCSPLSMGTLLDYCTPFGLILLACVRMGCFFQGCCGGITFWLSNSTPLILPVQLMEVVLDLILLELCFRLETSHFRQGLLYPVFLMGYGAVRFLLEFLRNTPKEWLVFSNGQIFALVSILLGVLLYRHFQKQAALAAKSARRGRKASRTGQKS